MLSYAKDCENSFDRESLEVAAEAADPSLPLQDPRGVRGRHEQPEQQVPPQAAEEGRWHSFRHLH